MNSEETPDQYVQLYVASSFFIFMEFLINIKIFVLNSKR